MKAPRTNTSALSLFAALLLLFAAPPHARAQAPAAQRPEQTPAQKPSPTTPKTPPLAGRVVGEGGEPIPDVVVYARSRAAGPIMRSPRVVATDEAGNFQFSELDHGLYTLYASIPGYVSEATPGTGATYRPGDNATVRLVRGGVVTGAVTDQQGAPLVGLSVRALRVRDLEGHALQLPFTSTVEDRTDDRGVYRIYGLQPGVYVVFTGGLTSNAFGPAAAYGGDVPTFYPSATRDTAAEVTVRSGQEATGIDIRYREEQGHRVTGTVDLAPGASSEFGVGVALTYPGTGMPAGGSSVNLLTPERAFSIEGVADGDYDIQASGGGREGMTTTSAPQRVTVRGADATGLRLTLLPLASVSGTLRIEPAAAADLAREACKSAARASQLPQETLVTAAPERAPGTSRANRPTSRLSAPHDTTPDETGDFSIRSLEAGRYRLALRLFDEALYVRTVQLPAAAPQTAAAPVARDVFELKAGQQFTGLSVRLAEGAASFAGRVAPAEGATPQTPAPTRVHLVPQERERAEETLRYYEGTVAADGAFSFKNLAPGRYLVLARAETDAGDAAPRPAARDTDARARLRREAEAAAATVELQPCQRTADFVLKYPAK